MSENDVITNERVLQATTSLRLEDSNVVRFNPDIYLSIKTDQIPRMQLT